MLNKPNRDAPPTRLLSRAWYSASIDVFLTEEPKSVIGELAKNGDFALMVTQRNAWAAQITFLRDQLKGLNGSILLEFTIPRIGRRIDAVLLIGPVVFVVEFKVGKTTFDRAAIDQVWDYALDLKNFHEASHRASLVPILVATQADQSAAVELIKDDDDVYRPVQVHAAGFREVVDLTMRTITGRDVD